MSTCKLSVNINKIALIRNSRGNNYPDLVQVAKDCESFGADGITVHPRPDQRHVRFDDIALLKQAVQTELNIEGNPTPSFLKLVLDNCPAQCTLVPDADHALTSDSGWDCIKHHDFLKDICQMLQEKNIRVSIFLNPEPKQFEALATIGTDRIELYTGNYAKYFYENSAKAVEPFHLCSMLARDMKIGLNAGHDLNLNNLKYFYQNTVDLLEVSIGHALVVDSIYSGLKTTINQYKNCLS